MSTHTFADTLRVSHVVSSALAQRPDIFKVAISGAPVVSWDLYDTGQWLKRERERDRQTNRHTGRQASRQEGRQTGRQTDNHYFYLKFVG